MEKPDISVIKNDITQMNTKNDKYEEIIDINKEIIDINKEIIDINK